MKRILLALALFLAPLPALADGLVLPGGGSGTPGGSTTQCQYNNAGSFGGVSGCTSDGTTITLVGPILGTPASVTLTNATGLPLATGITGFGSGVATFLGTPSSANLAASVTDETGSGLLAFATSPVFTTPNIGAATATTINKVTVTAPASAATLTIANNKTLTISNSLTFAGTDSTTMTFPAGSDSVAGLATAQTFSAADIFSAAGAASTPGLTISGTPYTAGTATTNFPQVYVNTTGATGPTTFSTSGTLFGINSASGFAGNFMDVHLNGGASLFKIDSAGKVYTPQLLGTSGSCAGIVTLAGQSDTGTGIALNGDQSIRLCANGTQIGNLQNAGDFVLSLGIAASRSGIKTVGAAPALSACGTSPSISGTDLAGEVTMGTGSPTGCVITFTNTKTNAPYCTVTSQSQLTSFAYSISTSAISTVQTATSSNKIDYVCFQH